MFFTSQKYIFYAAKVCIVGGLNCRNNEYSYLMLIVCLQPEQCQPIARVATRRMCVQYTRQLHYIALMSYVDHLQADHG